MFDGCSHLCQYRITGLMTVAVVHRFKKVDIQHQQSGCTVLPAAAAQLGMDGINKTSTIIFKNDE